MAPTAPDVATTAETGAIIAFEVNSQNADCETAQVKLHPLRE